MTDTYGIFRPASEYDVCTLCGQLVDQELLDAHAEQVHALLPPTTEPAEGQQNTVAAGTGGNLIPELSTDERAELERLRADEAAELAAGEPEPAAVVPPADPALGTTPDATPADNLAAAEASNTEPPAVP